MDLAWWLVVGLWVLGMPLMSSDMRTRGGPGAFGRLVIVVLWPVLMALCLLLWVVLSLAGEV